MLGSLTAPIIAVLQTILIILCGYITHILRTLRADMGIIEEAQHDLKLDIEAQKVRMEDHTVRVEDRWRDIDRRITKVETDFTRAIVRLPWIGKES